MHKILNSKLSVRLSILIGKHMPRKMGAWIIKAFSSILGSSKNLDLTIAVRSNQNVVSGGTLSDRELVQRTKQVISHAGHCFFNLYHYYDNPEKLDIIAPWSESMTAFVNYSQEDQGYLVVAPHLSNFDLVMARLVQGGFVGKILSYPNPGSGYQLQNEIRESFGLDVVPLGDSSLEAEIVEYLKAGGLVATGVDRPVPTRKKRHYAEFFGRPSPLPLGYITTALAADVPIIVVAAFMGLDGKYGLRISKPITLNKYKNKLDDIIHNAERVLKKVEEFIKLSPEQWLMYYPVWPDQMNGKS
ncbi:MAG: lysophospholipid acyltransferase family protein [Anaerolineales bacterium]|nr:lysophospholipid acyltransferase family protein [Anaerolineales bacterium]